MPRLPHPTLRLLLVLALGLGGGAAATVGAQEPNTPTPTTPTPTTPPVVSPCSPPPRGLLCPDLVMRRPYGLQLRRTKSSRSLLASTNAIVNIGDGPLEVRGRRFTRTRMAARQVLRARRGFAARVLPENGGRIAFFDTRSRGVYWKFEDAARFELWQLDENGVRTRLVRTSPKIYYCYRDLRRVRRLDTRRPYARSPKRLVFPACSQTGRIRDVTLGTSVGWADIYPHHYPQNWIDVTGLAGCFAYVHIADPEQRFAELREDNNASAVSVRLPWRGSGGRRGCPAVAPGEPQRSATDPVPEDSGVTPPQNPYRAEP